MATPTFKDITELAHMVNPTGEERIQVNAAESVTLAQIAALALKALTGIQDLGQLNPRIVDPSDPVKDIIEKLANRLDNGRINLFRLDKSTAPAEWVVNDTIQCGDQYFDSILALTWEWGSGDDVRNLLYFIMVNADQGSMLDRLWITIAHEDDALSTPDDIDADYLLTVLEDTLDNNIFGNAVRLADVIGIKQSVTKSDGFQTLTPVVQSGGRVYVNVPTGLNGIGLFKVTNFVVDLSGLYDLPGVNDRRPQVVLPSVPSLGNNSALRFYIKSPIFPSNPSSGLPYSLLVTLVPSGFSPDQSTDQVILSGEIKSGPGFIQYGNIYVPCLVFEKFMEAGDPPSDAGYGFLVEVKSIGSTISIDAKKVYKYNSVTPNA